jgi:hypothetical protein
LLYESRYNHFSIEHCLFSFKRMYRSYLQFNNQASILFYTDTDQLESWTFPFWQFRPTLAFNFTRTYRCSNFPGHFFNYKTQILIGFNTFGCLAILRLLDTLFQMDVSLFQFHMCTRPLCSYLGSDTDVCKVACLWLPLANLAFSSKGCIGIPIL